MKLQFIGAGSAFTTETDNYHSNMLLEDDQGERLLIDCGTDARHALKELGLDYKNITDVYISHLHADHAGGLEWLGFTRKFDPDCELASLYISDHICDDLWNRVLSGGMRSLQGEVAQLDTYFKVHRISSNDKFTWRNITLNLVQTVHIMDGFSIVPSFGLMFKVGDKNVFITTDTQFAPTQMLDFYKMADLVFQDCETSPGKSGVHARFEELETLDADLKAKMWLYHYSAGALPDAQASGFRGFVKKGQSFDLSDEGAYA